MKQQVNENSNSEPVEMLSINDVLKAWKAHYIGRNQWLFKLHMAWLIPWLVIRYGLVESVLTYIRKQIGHT